MGIVEDFKSFCRYYFRLRNGRDGIKFDEDLHAILQFYYCLGFYQPAPTKKRIVFGILMFIFGPLSYTLGAVKDAWIAYHEEDVTKIVLNVFCMGFGITMITQIVTFVCKRKRIIDMMGQLQSLHEHEDDEAMEVYRRKCKFSVKFYLFYVNFCIVILIVLYCFGYNQYKLISPAVYDVWANGYATYFLLFINTISSVVLTFVFTAGELIHLLCMVRVDANLKFLSEKLRRCADGENLLQNEKDLIACVKYHSATIR